jgi:hypothetical protein
MSYTLSQFLVFSMTVGMSTIVDERLKGKSTEFSLFALRCLIHIFFSSYFKSIFFLDFYLHFSLRTLI